MKENQLRYLFEAHRLGTMRAASDYLDVAPSSISRQISLLEKGLGLCVIERGTRGIRLTEAGELLIRYFSNGQTQLESLQSQLDDLRGIRSGRVALAVGEGYVGTVLSKVINAFLSTHPGVRFQINVGGTNDVVQSVLDDEAHMGLVFEAPPEPKIRVRSTFPQPVCVVMSQDHWLANRKTLTLDDIHRLPVALPHRSFRIRHVVEHALHTQDLHWQPQLTSDSLLILKNFARLGQGITLLPPLAVASEARAGELSVVPVAHSALSSTRASIITRLGRQLPVAAWAMLNRLENSIGDWL